MSQLSSVPSYTHRTGFYMRVVGGGVGQRARRLTSGVRGQYLVAKLLSIFYLKTF